MVGRLLLCLWFSSLIATVRMAFEEKYTIVNKANQLVHLSCNASSDQLRDGIHWRLDGVPLSKNAHSNTLDLEVTDRPDAGNYSCHLNSTTELLKHYYLLIDVGRQTDRILKEENGNYVTCHAERFGKNFTCLWKEREKAIFSASFHREGGNGDSKECVLTRCNNAKCTIQATCTDNTFSPYAEELRQIIFTMEAATSKLYEKHIKHFYIRDILKPAAPKELKTQNLSKASKVEVTVNWQYPDSWNNPHSYFPLLSKVNIELSSRKAKRRAQIISQALVPCSDVKSNKHHRINCITENSSVTFSVTHKQFNRMGRICVQVKELFFNSTWSEPSCCTMSKSKGKQGGKNKDQVWMCSCPMC